MHRLERMIPPPLALALVAAAMWRLAPRAAGPPGLLRWSWALAFAAMGATLVTAAAWRIFRAGTTIDPVRIDRASKLVVGGVYRLSRNPIYLADALFLVAYAGWLASPAAFLGPVALIAWLTRFQIAPEERTLAAKFGADYDSYRARVRRWA